MTIDRNKITDDVKFACCKVKTNMLQAAEEAVDRIRINMKRQWLHEIP